MLRSYLRLMLFGLGLLVGVQVPGFMADYGKRVESHRIEAAHSLEGFQDTARRFFAGDLNALVAHYADSEDPVFRSDARSLNTLLQRKALLDREWQAMQSPWYAKAWHLLTGADRALLEETYNGYRYQVLLSPDAIAWALCCGLLLAWLAELLVLLFAAAFAPRPRRVRHQGGR